MPAVLPSPSGRAKLCPRLLVSEVTLLVRHPARHPARGHYELGETHLSEVLWARSGKARLGEATSRAHKHSEGRWWGWGSRQISVGLAT